MSSIYYNGLVSMKPEMEKKDFLADPYDYGFSYQVPKVCFECEGEIYDSQSVFEWNDDSLMVIKDNCIVKYTKSNFRDVLVRDTDGKKHWLENMIADIYGFGDEDVEASIERKQYTIAEYDLDKSEKRIYEVILKETVKLDHGDERYIQEMLDKTKEQDGAEHWLSENLE